ncbi:helix-turn-helix domain-containing protein [Paractinoplanes brasiliensis]|uniref:Helix-turn-helix protein n=1 Tax=Paractinoplanes brasiliensis TaxID=52695 RepID=A0A4R6JND9_9ACTN|nr:helix-turn-helix transcriptional regulator [Actinoplanes brasiliensis]TDO36901.1 helix-turn-helix protein [Actinoplanes brasiliensis]GID30421.1 XRE family transcriptional regulator [Actinoplanes brasiliensis]
MPAPPDPRTGHIEVLPLMVVAQAFPARPSALPDVRDFVRRQLTDTRLSDDDVRILGERVADVLLDAAGSSGAIQVSLRIFPDSAEVDVLFSPDPAVAAGPAGSPRRGAPPAAGTSPAADRGARIADHRPRPAPEPEALQAPPDNGSPSFAAWLSNRLRAEGLTMDAAARRLEVSTKTISRWVSGTTEPRLRDLYRIRDVFGEPPFR